MYLSLIRLAKVEQGGREPMKFIKTRRLFGVVHKLRQGGSERVSE